MDRIEQLTITVTWRNPHDESALATETRVLDPQSATLPLTFGIVPRSSTEGASAKVELTLSLKAPKATLSTAASTVFQRGKQRLLDLYLESDCLEVQCPKGQTCGHCGVCAPIADDTSVLPAPRENAYAPLPACAPEGIATQPRSDADVDATPGLSDAGDADVLAPETMDQDVMPPLPPPVPGFTRGSSALTRPELLPLFWGTRWNNAQPTPQDFVMALQWMVRGPYLTPLREYETDVGTFQSARVVPYADLDVQSDPPLRWSELDVAAEIRKRIESGHLPAPKQESDEVYVVFVAKGDASTSCQGTPPPPSCSALTRIAHHGQATYRTPQGDEPFSFIVLRTNESFESATAALAGELVNTITNPDGLGFVTSSRAGCVHSNLHGACLPGSTAGTCQPCTLSQDGMGVADVCSSELARAGGSARTTSNGFGFVAYWSRAQNTCVANTSWHSLRTFEDDPLTVDIRDERIAQAVAGDVRLFALDENGTVGRYTQQGSLGEFESLNNPEPCAILSVTEGAAHCLSRTGESIWSLRESSPEWQRRKGPAWSLISGNGTHLFRTASDGIWEDTEFVATWNFIADRANQLANAKDELFGIHSQRTSAFRYKWVGYEWENIGPPPNELLAGTTHIAALSYQGDVSVRRVSDAAATWLPVASSVSQAALVYDLSRGEDVLYALEGRQLIRRDATGKQLGSTLLAQASMKLLGQGTRLWILEAP